MKYSTVVATLLASSSVAALKLTNVAPLINEVDNNSNYELKRMEEQAFVEKFVELSCSNDEKCDMCKMIADTIEDKAPELTKDAVKEVESFCKSVESQTLIHTACEAAKSQFKPLVEKFLEHIDGQCDKLPFCQHQQNSFLDYDYKPLCNNNSNKMSCEQCQDMTKQLEDKLHGGLSTVESTLTSLCALLGSGKEDCDKKMKSAVDSVRNQIDNYLNPVCKTALHLCD